jgi:hypothetical protein
MSILDNNKSVTQNASAPRTFDPTVVASNHSQERTSPAHETTGEDQPTGQRPIKSSAKHKPEIKKHEKPLVAFGLACIVVCLGWLIFSPSTPTPDTSSAGKAALATKVSTTLDIGAVLLSSDEGIGEQNPTIAHSATDQNSTKIWVWDYAAEDGDYVQILVNGVPVGAPFMIKHKPAVIDLPLNGLVGEVQVKGVRDGGGGITYAVHWELNKTTYFNSAPEGEFNTYTLVAAAN